MIYFFVSILIISAIAGATFYLDKKIAYIKESLLSRCTPLTKESLLEFIREEKARVVEAMDDSPFAVFKYGEDTYGLNTSRLPQQFIMRKSYDISEDPHKDLLWAAAIRANESVVIAKVLLREDRIDFMIVSMDHTVEQLRENFDAYLSLIADAERRFSDEMEVLIKSQSYDEEGGTIDPADVKILS